MSKKNASRGAQIDSGSIECRTLSECLKVDFATLYTAIFPASAAKAKKQLREMAELGILKRMEAAARLVIEHEGHAALDILAKHSSDTARAWAAFLVGNQENISLEKRLKLIQPFADDSHFGVREWAWMAVRRHVANDLGNAIQVLELWTAHSSFRIRRFASEATRPRGVWSEHIPSLKEKPEQCLAILEALKADPERYVQDSVGNWLNDAAKSQPQWVKKICIEWIRRSKGPETAYIVKRALRSLK